MLTYSKQIAIEPSKLNNNLIPYIKETLDKNIGNCTKKDGYILEIGDILSFKSMPISRASGEIVVEVSYQANTILPKLGDTFTGTVKMAFKYGILVSVNDILKVLITTSPFLNDYQFENDKYVNKENGEEIKMNDTIELVIHNVIYDNNSFKCLGKLKN